MLPTICHTGSCEKNHYPDYPDIGRLTENLNARGTPRAVDTLRYLKVVYRESNTSYYKSIALKALLKLDTRQNVRGKWKVVSTETVDTLVPLAETLSMPTKSASNPNYFTGTS